MEKTITNLIIFIAICFLVYILFRSFNYKEGMTTNDASGNNYSVSNIGSGAAGNADNYAAAIKNATVQIQDALLVSKYKSDYETVILNLDDLVNSLMLNTALSVNAKSPLDTLNALNNLNDSKLALNNVMKYIDSQ